MTSDLFSRARAALRERDPASKGGSVHGLQADWLRDALVLDVTGGVEPIVEPGRPDRPRLVSPRAVPRRSLATLEGRAALIHALAHIEFNAVIDPAQYFLENGLGPIASDFAG